MRQIVINKSLFEDVLRINSQCDTFCSIINCTLVKLHEGAELYACLRAGGGEPCKLYVADCAETVAKSISPNENEWIEAVGNMENLTIYYCKKNKSQIVEKSAVFSGVETPKMATALCDTMEKLSVDGNKILIIKHEKKYTDNVRRAFQKRSVLDLSSIDSRGVDVVYFDGATKLVEKLLYSGCRELTVFIKKQDRSEAIVRDLDKLSRRAPFSNTITVVIGDEYSRKTPSKILVGHVRDLDSRAVTRIFFSTNYAEGEGFGISVGQNTENTIPDEMGCKLKPFAIHYITSIMSELILKATTSQSTNARRLFKVNAKSLKTETIIKEN